jgi:hypothetical protein
MGSNFPGIASPWGPELRVYLTASPRLPTMKKAGYRVSEVTVPEDPALRAMESEARARSPR